MAKGFEYSVEEEKRFRVLLDETKDLIRGYHKSMSKGKINDELKKRDTDDRERVYWEERAPKLLDELDHKFRDTVWIDWVKNKHTSWLTELLKDSELVDYVPAMKELKSFMKKEEKVAKSAPPPKAKKIKKKNGQTDQKLIMRNYAIIAVAVLLLASVPWFLAVQSLQNNNNELQNNNNDLESSNNELQNNNNNLVNDIDIKVEEISGLNERISSLVADNEEREKNSAILQNDMDSRIQELNELNVRLSELASENEERQKVSANLNNEIASLENKFEEAQERVNALRAEIAVIQCLDCQITLNYGVTNEDDPLIWGSASRWNEFTGSLLGSFDPQTAYRICISVANPESDDDDGFAEEWWQIGDANTDEEGKFQGDWKAGVGYTYYVDDQESFENFISSLPRDENNVAIIYVDAWICDNDVAGVDGKFLTEYRMPFHIKLPDVL